ncbi:hypothetical protein R3P38DRAFT_2760807 [Favolaschia claudopus]|uniref:Uncharacterized protein n=1 Tax=Favolaschia claudopus TaxID=2862362 RepID=A0AAW0DSR2_9AGAR
MTDLVAFREELLKDPYYLGREEVISKVGWNKVGRDEMVVSAEEAAKRVPDNENQSTADPDVEDGEVSEVGEPATLNPVRLTAVAMVSADDCWLTPCGNWKGRTKFTPNLADLKLNCRLVAPSASPFAVDFKVVMKTIKKLMAQVETAGYEKSGIFNAKENPKATLKIRHVVFEQKEEDEDDEPDAFALRDWPVISPEAKEALEEMDNSHRVVPMRAYDVNGDLIAPANYMAKLQGAVVRATLTLSHWNIVKEKRNTYAADIDSLRVLVPPSVSSSGSSPRKRRAGPIAQKDPGASPSPKKKARGD